MLKTAVSAVLFLSLFVAGRSSLAGDVRKADWGMSLEQVIATEDGKPLVVARENEFGRQFDVLLYHIHEESLEADVRYLFDGNALRIVSVEYSAGDPEKLYAEFVEVFRKYCTRGHEVEQAMKRMAELLKKYPHVKLPKDALHLLADPEKILGLASFENGRTSIRIPFRTRENSSIVPIYYIDTNYLEMIRGGNGKNGRD